MEPEPKIFIIMPFSETTPSHSEEYWTNHYEYLLKPCVRSIANLPFERSEPIRTDILRGIIKNLIFSQIVIADITDLNANVLWELGVRQSFRNATIIIAEEGTPIPFDISIKGIITYPILSSDACYHSDMKKFKDKLQLAINDCLNNPNTIDSHVLETISGRGTIYQIIFHDDILRKLDALINEFELNIQLMQICVNLINKNKSEKDELNYQIPVKRFGNCCVEHLVTTRYLIKDSNFYRLIRVYFDGLQSMNFQFESWRIQRTKTVESFLEEMTQNMIPISNKLLSDIKDIKKDMENQA
jgi:hypothetical protein